MKIVVTGTRGIPNIMGGVETHCEELFPRMVERGYDVTLIRRSNYVKDDLHEWKGVKLVTIPSPKKKSFEAIIHTFRAINEAKSWALMYCISMPSVLHCWYHTPNCWA